MTEKRKLQIFLCHSKEDKPRVREIFRRLIADGFDAWLDEERLKPGQDWELEIYKAVRNADIIMICLSRNSITKAGYVQKEIRIALDIADEQPEGAIFLIPVRFEDCQVPARLAKTQWVDLFAENGYERLRDSLRFRESSLGIRRRKTKQSGIVRPKMVLIPAGKFLMGSTPEQVAQAIKTGLKAKSLSE